MSLDTKVMAVDIETSCGMTTCNDSGCKHALDPHRSRITVIGVYYLEKGVPYAETFRSLDRFEKFISNHTEALLVGHNFKFDIHHLLRHGVDLTGFDWRDTQVLASVCLDKISDQWLSNYERQRTQANKSLPRGSSHRRAGKLSLKTLAPFFLNAEPFWENPLDHDNDEYVLKDCEHTYNLYVELLERVTRQGHIAFYDKLMAWTKTLLSAEIRGIKLDMQTMTRESLIATRAADEAKANLDATWNAAYQAYFDMQAGNLWCAYADKMERALSKLKKSTPRQVEQTKARYNGLYEKSLLKLDRELNLNSPSQLMWLLRDYLQLNVKNFDGEETTDKEVLERLAMAGREDIKQLLEYRKNTKLATAFFPTYRELQVNDTLHCTFNPTGTRTGRLSSSNPNLQQVPRGLHHLFVARPRHKLITMDMSAIEPALMGFHSEDQTLCEVLMRGENFHSFITKGVFGYDEPSSEIKKLYPRERNFAKEFDLSEFYGAKWRRVKASAMKHGFDFTDAECKSITHWFHETFHGFFEWKIMFDRFLQEGNTAVNLIGRPFKLPPKDVYMKGVNTLIQSGASDLVLMSATKIQERVQPLGGNVLLLVHDEIVTEIPEQHAEEALNIINKSMTEYDLTNCWGQIKLSTEGNISDHWEK